MMSDMSSAARFTTPPARAALMITCVVDVVAAEVAEATVRVLRAGGFTVSCDLTQTCCGQPAWNAGFADHAASVARPTLAALEAELDRGADVVVVPAGSCATMVRLFWPELFERVGDRDAVERAKRVAGRTRELSELLGPQRDALGPLALDQPSRVGLHQGCHLLWELRVEGEAGRLLADVAGCEVIDWEGADRCCGFGGTFSVKPPEASVAMTDEKLQSLQARGPDMLVGCDPSCLLHLRSRAEALGTAVEVRHLAEVLDAALPSSTGPSSTGGSDRP